ncbi:hypothetical protein LB542_20195 [Mesorhizobium sp. BR1-1-9]|uniref:Tc toxin subunit A-related protein n=1 Tax=unclassified Mesorhizobium TaxID=325217 RepID=UPI001CD11B10|nr:MULTISPECIES: hypothetical protein [unclassified Mesorhizobium]MBZ9873172.1 hypothetical protein [Mesorhizobium sp. BR1-1-9]MBZ9945017.1 hypothetical protein [Mesorhizobium sp. BR1-1-13]
MSSNFNSEASAALVDEVILSGTTRHQGTRLPVSGIALAWTATLKGPLVGKERTVVLGETVSGRDGSFALHLADTPDVREAYRFLRISSESTSVLAASGNRLATSAIEPPKGSRSGLALFVKVKPRTKSVPKEDLKSLGAFLAVNRLATAGDLSNQLATPWLDSPVTTWTAEARLRALGDLDIEMKKADRSGSRNGRDQLLDFEIIDAGRLTGSVTDQLAPGPWPFGDKSDLGLYRDYLRGVWVSAARFMHEMLPLIGKRDVPASTLETQLNNRLHQNFRTFDETQKNPATLLAEILKPALTTAKEAGGFGKTAVEVPAKTAGESSEDYLTKLVQLSGSSRTELEKRLRVRFDTLAGATTSRMQLNVDALRGFLSDSFQAPFDPYDAKPDIYTDPLRPKPIIPRQFAGKAPFYLQYEEWLERRKPFYCENLFDIRRTIPDFSPAYRNEFTQLWGKSDFDAANGEQEFSEENQPPTESTDGVGALIVSLFTVVDKLKGAIWQIDNNDFGGAMTSLTETGTLGGVILSELLKQGWYRSEFIFQPRNFSDKERRALDLEERAAIDTSTLEGLATLETFFQAPDFPLYNPFWPIVESLPNVSMDEGQTMRRVKAPLECGVLYVHWLEYVLGVTIPALRACIAQALGDYATTVRELGALTGIAVGVAEQETIDAYHGMGELAPSANPVRLLFTDETLPYTTSVSYDEKGARENTYPLRTFRTEPYRDFALSPCEWRAFKIAQGRAMLDWAEQLFRTDDPSGIRRARELYKGVLFLHGADPGTIPTYPKDGDPILVMVMLIGNPAIRAQVERANYGLFLIEEGLNAYGWREDMVPILRYRPLKDASDGLAAAAKSAQNDFIAYTDRFEQAQLDRMYAALLAERAAASVGIANEQIAIAQNDVKLAQEQVKAIKKQIEKKQQEIDDHDSFFNQFKDYLGGAKSALDKLTKKDKSGESTGSKAMVELGALGGGGAMIMGGMAAFVYVSWISMEGMEKEANRRADEIKRLRDVALPAAMAQVAIRRRTVTIADYQKRIAEADRQYADALMRFDRDRFLSADTWAKLATVAERLMVYYVDNAARMGWLAERALAFEQARPLNIIRKNYLPRAMRGLTGPDTLQADLAALENSRLSGVKLTMPARHTTSLAREFPLAFGALKRTGRCSFATKEASLQQHYPGLFGFRIRSVGVEPQLTGADLVRGTLRNRGVSCVGTDGGASEQLLIRFPDALPISEFRMKDDMDVFGLPGETLLQFEGSGFTTEWEITLAPDSAVDLVDLLITFDGFGFYSDAAFVEPATGTGSSTRCMLFAGSAVNPTGVAALRNGSANQLALDLSGFGATDGTARAISNIALLCIGGEGPASVLLTATGTGETASAAFARGIALSNMAPLDGSSGAMPLNAFHGVPVDQPFTLDFGAADLSDLTDVAVLLEYSTF